MYTCTSKLLQITCSPGSLKDVISGDMKEAHDIISVNKDTTVRKVIGSDLTSAKQQSIIQLSFSVLLS